MPSARKSNRTDQQKKELKRGWTGGEVTSETFNEAKNKVVEFLNSDEVGLKDVKVDNLTLILNDDLQKFANNLQRVPATNAVSAFLQFKILMDYFKSRTAPVADIAATAAPAAAPAPATELTEKQKILIIDELVRLLKIVVQDVRNSMLTAHDPKIDEDGKEKVTVSVAGGRCVMSPEMKKILNTGHLF